MASTAPNLWEPQTVGERLLRLRERAGMEQAEVAERLTDLGAPASQSHVSRFEKWGSLNPKNRKSARKPQWAHLCAYARIFDVRFADLGATEAEYPELRFVKDAVSRVYVSGKSPRLRLVAGQGLDSKAKVRRLAPTK